MKLEKTFILQAFILCIAVAYGLKIEDGLQFNTYRNKYTCEPVKSDICKKIDRRYNSTGFPNFRGDVTQRTAIATLNSFTPLINIRCSKDLPRFLCSVYLPFCMPHINQIIPPCREICLSAQKGCSNLMKSYNYTWPFNCNQFPVNDGTAVCVSSDLGSSGEHQKKTLGNEKQPIQYPSKRVWQEMEKNEQRYIGCKSNTVIYIRKVKHKKSTCCHKASKEVLSAICNGKAVCLVKNTAEFLGAHCSNGQGKLLIKFRCVPKNSSTNCQSKSS